MEHYAVIKITRSITQDESYLAAMGVPVTVKNLAAYLGKEMGLPNIVFTGFTKQDSRYFSFFAKVELAEFAQSHVLHMDVKDIYGSVLNLDKQLMLLQDKSGFQDTSIESIHALGHYYPSYQELIDEFQGQDAKNGVGLESLSASDVLSRTVFQSGTCAILSSDDPYSFAVVRLNDDGTCSPVPESCDMDFNDAQNLACAMTGDENIASFGL